MSLDLQEDIPEITEEENPVANVVQSPDVVLDLVKVKDAQKTKSSRLRLKSTGSKTVPTRRTIRSMSLSSASESKILLTSIKYCT